MAKYSLPRAESGYLIHREMGMMSPLSLPKLARPQPPMPFRFCYCGEEMGYSPQALWWTCSIGHTLTLEEIESWPSSTPQA